MDTISHGLWGSIAFGKSEGWRGRRKVGALFLAFVIGMMPDLLSFGPHFFSWAFAGFPAYPIEPGTTGAPALASLPWFVVPAYRITHSLVIWAAVFLVLRWIFGRRAWIFGAWGLHILCDIPTHSTRYFPTPFLWPFPTPYVDGIMWGAPWFMAVNYASIAVVIFILWLRRRRASTMSP